MNSIERFATSSDGINIAYQIRRKKGKPFVLFLGGLSGSYSSWEGIEKYFEKAGYSTLSIDYRGHGYSGLPKKKESFEMKWFVEDVLAVMKQEKIKNITIVGHCFGGMIALAMHDKFPQKIKSIIVINATYTNPYSRAHFPKALNNFLKYFFRFSYSMLRMIFDHWPLNLIPYKRMDIKKSRHFPAWYSLFSGAVFHTHFRTMLQGQITMIDLDARESLKKMKKPFLIIANKHDFMMPMERAVEMNKLAKGSELFIHHESHKPITHFDKGMNLKMIDFLKRHKI